MYDLILIATLTLPLLAVMLAGRYFERGLLDATPEEQAKRRYRLAWVTNLTIVVKLVGFWLAVENFGMQMEGTIGLLKALAPAAGMLTAATSPWVAKMLITSLGMAAVVLYYSLYSLPWLRLDRIAKQAKDAEARRTQARLTMRSTLAGLLPMLLWFGLFNALPRDSFDDPVHWVPLLGSFILLVQSLSPWLVQLAQPTAPLPDNHPVVQMARELARAAGVRISAVRVIKAGEARVANALVSGLWPWLRHIYVTDHMIDTFSVDEIRAVLAHEVGHIRHRHLWWYLAIALGGGFLIPHMTAALSMLAFMGDSIWSFMISFGIYWGVMFKAFSRRFERQADRFAVAATGDVAIFLQSLEKLAEANGTVRTYSKWDIFQTHPPIEERVKALGWVH